MIKYIKDNRKIIFFVLLLSFVLFAQKIIYPSVGYDTDQYLSNPEETHRVWISHGRYALAWMSHYLGRLWMDPHVANALTCINVTIYTVLFLAFLNLLYTERDRKRDILIEILLISSPVFLEQYYFTLQTVEVSFSIILMIVAYICTYYWIMEQRNRYGVVTFLLLVFVFGIYQTHVVLYIIGVLLILLKVNHEESKENFNYIFKCSLVWSSSLAAYYVIKKLVGDFMNIPDSGYLTGQITWLSGTIVEACFMIVKSVGRVVFGIGHVLNLSYLICLVCIVYSIRKSDKIITWKNFYLLALMVSPLLLNILMASRLLIRSVLGVPIVCAYIFWKYCHDYKWMRTLLIIMIISQIINGQILLYADNVCYKNDITIAKKIYRDCNADQNTVIVIKGMEHPEDTKFSFKGQALGHSFFEWSNGGKDADEMRIQYFMHLQGMDFQIPTEEQKREMQAIEFRNSYPDNGYAVEKDGCWFVNLGE